MLVDWESKTAFIHIPKNGGTTVRKTLSSVMVELSFSERKFQSMALPCIDLGHAPAAYYKNYFPELLKELQKCKLYCLLRNPIQRFSSSVSMRLRVLNPNQPFRYYSRSEVRDVVGDIIKYLGKNETRIFHPPEWAHIQRQTDYIFADGAKVFEPNIFTESEISVAIEEIIRALGYDSKKFATAIHKNRSIVYSSKSFAQYVNAEPAGKISFLKKLLMKIDSRYPYIFQREFSRQFSDILLSDEVLSFCHWYYAKDIEFYNSFVEPSGDQVRRRI